jgi:hypothetical protein
MLERDHELLPRDARGADDPDGKYPAHDVTSSAKWWTWNGGGEGGTTTFGARSS